jgi:hypothetical protein
MLPGTVSPFVIRFDAGKVLAGYIVFSGETRTVDQIQDLAPNRVIRCWPTCFPNNLLSPLRDVSGHDQPCFPDWTQMNAGAKIESAAKSLTGQSHLTEKSSNGMWRRPRPREGR